MIFVEGGSSPTFKHTEYYNALDESKRLAEITGKEVFILKSITTVSLPPKFIVEKINDDDNMQF